MENDPQGRRGAHRKPGALKRFGQWVMRPFTREDIPTIAPPAADLVPPATPLAEADQFFVAPMQPDAEQPQSQATTDGPLGRPYVDSSFSAPPATPIDTTRPTSYPNRYRPFDIADEDGEDEAFTWGQYPTQPIGRVSLHVPGQFSDAPAAPEAPDTQRQPDIDEETVVISYLPGGNKISFRSTRGHDRALPATYGSAKAAKNAFDALSGVFAFGFDTEDPQRVRVSHAAEQLNRKSYAVRKILENLAQKAPEGSITIDDDYCRFGFAVFGNVAIASEVPPPGTRQRQATESTATQAWPERTTTHEESAEEEAEKFGLMEYDHAVITTPDRPFVLPLASNTAILTARCIEALLAEEKDTPLNYIDIAQTAWAAMPTSERRLFASSRKLTEERQGTAIRKDVLKVLRGLTPRMKLTRECGNEDFKTLITDFSITYSEASPDPDLLANEQTALLFPPGTPRSEISSYKDPIEVTDNDRETAATLIGYIEAMFPKGGERGETRPDISNEAALEYLDFVTSREGKAALRDILKTSGSFRNPDRIVRTIRRQIIRPVLGSGYGSAWQNRTVAGGHMTGDKTGRVRQTGGALRGSTTKWHIGITYDDGRTGRGTT